MVLYVDGNEMNRFSLNEFITQPIDGIYKNVEENELVKDTVFDQKSFYMKKVDIANIIIELYKKTSIIVFAIALISFLWELIDNFVKLFKKRKTNFSLWMIKLGILLTIFVNVIIVSLNYFDAYNREGAKATYVAGIIPLWQISVCLSIYWLVRKIIELININKEKRRRNSDEINNSDTMF